VDKGNRSPVPAPGSTDKILSSILDQTGREGLGLGLDGSGGFGLGFRAAIPKMPSFRVSWLPASQVCSLSSLVLSRSRLVSCKAISRNVTVCLGVSAEAECAVASPRGRRLAPRRKRSGGPLRLRFGTGKRCVHAASQGLEKKRHAARPG